MRANSSETHGGPESNLPAATSPLRHFRRLIFLAAILGGFFIPQLAKAFTLAELKAEPDLTPERFIKHFADFKFELGRDVRPPDKFLASKSGDCDDFATLASSVLRERGYQTKLVAIFMDHDVHVVCYVAGINAYLDYNCRKLESPLVKCGPDLEAIATSVAKSFRAGWRSASEYTLKDGKKDFVSTVFR